MTLVGKTEQLILFNGHLLVQSAAMTAATTQDMIMRTGTPTPIPIQIGVKFPVKRKWMSFCPAVDQLVKGHTMCYFYLQSNMHVLWCVNLLWTFPFGCPVE